MINNKTDKQYGWECYLQEIKYHNNDIKPLKYKAWSKFYDQQAIIGQYSIVEKDKNGILYERPALLERQELTPQQLAIQAQGLIDLKKRRKIYKINRNKIK